MGRAMLRNLKIIGNEVGEFYIDLSGEEMAIACFFDGVTIVVSEGCRKGAFSQGYFDNCTILLHPHGPGRQAFNGCFFEDNCKWPESKSNNEITKKKETPNGKN